MSYKKKLKEREQKKLSVQTIAKLKTFWQQKLPVIFFVGGFFSLMILFYAVWMSDYFILQINPIITSAYATISSTMLNLFGQHTHSFNDSISSSAFSISVKRGCDAIEAIALFAAAMLVFPMPWKKKIKSMLLGILMLLTLNILRIVSLFLTGIYAPRAFDIMHIEIWETLFIFFALTLWIYFIRQNSKPKVNVAQ